MTTAPRLEVRDLAKSFGGIRALAGVNCSVEPGSIRALLGENGAGKSTLVKIVTGVQAPDRGQVLIDGRETRFASPMAARRAGVVAVYQDPRLFPHLNIAENVFMGVQPLTRLGTIAHRRMHAQAQRLLDELGAEMDVRRTVLGLSVGEAQFVEFARAMALGGMRLLFLDEPTASLSPVETERLFRLARRVKAEGTSVVFISHRLEELEGFVDTVTVLRDGAHVLTAPATALDAGAIVRAMVGRDLETPAPNLPGPPSAGGRLLEVEGLCVEGRVADVGFAVREGEVVGMAGLVGAGRSEIALAIMGVLKASAGRVRIAGEEVRRRSPRAMKRLGVAYVPEDRDRDGLVASHSIAANASLASLGRLSSLGVLRRRAEGRFVADMVERLQIKAGNTADPVSTLSGGNRQKVVIGKWFVRRPRIFILDEPTHGIDVGTKAHLHRLIRRLAADGAAVLVISSDLPEVLALSDRVLVVRNGRIVGEEARGTGEERVMALATGQASPPGLTGQEPPPGPTARTAPGRAA